MVKNTKKDEKLVLSIKRSEKSLIEKLQKACRPKIAIKRNACQAHFLGHVSNDHMHRAQIYPCQIAFRDRQDYFFKQEYAKKNVIA